MLAAARLKGTGWLKRDATKTENGYTKEQKECPCFLGRTWLMHEWVAQGILLHDCRCSFSGIHPFSPIL
jgi:hypothetical protein